MKQFFVIIGAQRSGTTYLYTLLDNHDDIKMAKPVRPEPKFFIDDNLYIKGKNFYEESFFSGPQNGIFGEKSTSYLEYPEAREKILEYYPDAKFIVLLRNPVDRAISNYYFTKENGFEKRSLENVFIDRVPSPVESNSISVSPFKYLERGNYYHFLKNWHWDVSSDRYYVIIQEKFIADTIDEFSSLLSFINAGLKVDKDLIMDKINASKPYEIPEKIQKYLNDYYRNDIEKLEEFLGISIEEWK